MLDKWKKQEDLKEEPIEVGDDIESVAESDDDSEEDGLESIDKEDNIDIDQLMEELSPEDAEKDVVKIESADEAQTDRPIDSRPSSSNNKQVPSSQKQAVAASAKVKLNCLISISFLVLKINGSFLGQD